MDQWDDGKHSGIRQFNLGEVGGQILDSINCTYDDDGDSVEGPNHGGNGGHSCVSCFYLLFSKKNFCTLIVESTRNHIQNI